MKKFVVLVVLLIALVATLVPATSHAQSPSNVTPHITRFKVRVHPNLPTKMYLNWRAVGMQENVNHLELQVLVGGNWQPLSQLAATGRTSFAIPTSFDGNAPTLRLALTNPNTVLDEKMQIVPIVAVTPTCDPFFFMETGRTYVYAGGGILNSNVFALCPSGAPVATNAIIQMFEQGLMVYRADLDVIYIMPNTGLAAIVPNTYIEGEVLNFPVTPPDGVFVPEGILGKAYAENYQLTQFLGWGAAPASLFYSMTHQSSNDTLFSWQGGTVMTLDSGGRFFVTHAELGGSPPVWAWLNATN